MQSHMLYSWSAYWSLRHSTVSVKYTICGNLYHRHITDKRMQWTSRNAISIHYSRLPNGFSWYQRNCRSKHHDMCYYVREWCASFLPVAGTISINFDYKSRCWVVKQCLLATTGYCTWYKFINCLTLVYIRMNVKFLRLGNTISSVLTQRDFIQRFFLYQAHLIFLEARECLHVVCSVICWLLLYQMKVILC